MAVTAAQIQNALVQSFLLAMASRWDIASSLLEVRLKAWRLSPSSFRASQILRMTLPKGRPSIRQRRAQAASVSGKVFATTGLIASDLSRETITFHASATTAFG